jgi:hypothetical protein
MMDEDFLMPWQEEELAREQAAKEDRLHELLTSGDPEQALQDAEHNYMRTALHDMTRTNIARMLARRDLATAKLVAFFHRMGEERGPSDSLYRSDILNGIAREIPALLLEGDDESAERAAFLQLKLPVPFSRTTQDQAAEAARQREADRPRLAALLRAAFALPRNNSLPGFLLHDGVDEDAAIGRCLVALSMGEADATLPPGIDRRDPRLRAAASRGVAYLMAAARYDLKRLEGIDALAAAYGLDLKEDEHIQKDYSAFLEQALRQEDFAYCQALSAVIPSRYTDGYERACHFRLDELMQQGDIAASARLVRESGVDRRILQRDAMKLLGVHASGQYVGPSKRLSPGAQESWDTAYERYAAAIKGKWARWSMPVERVTDDDIAAGLAETVQKKLRSGALDEAEGLRTLYGIPETLWMEAVCEAIFILQPQRPDDARRLRQRFSPSDEAIAAAIDGLVERGRADAVGPIVRSLPETVQKAAEEKHKMLSCARDIGSFPHDAVYRLYLDLEKKGDARGIARLRRIADAMSKAPSVRAEAVRWLKRMMDMEERTVGGFLEVLVRMERSKTPELLRVKDELIGNLATAEDPLAVYGPIERVFAGNLPTVAKTSKVFALLHPTKELRRKLAGDHLSPYLHSLLALRDADLEEAVHRTVFNDLLRINVESGNASLRTYLEELIDGEALIAALVAAPSGSFTDEDLLEMERWLDGAEALLATSNRPRSPKKEDAAQPADRREAILHRYDSLRDALATGDDATVADRVGQMFLAPLRHGQPRGAVRRSVTPSVALSMMDRAKEDAHRRSIELYDRSRENGGVIRLRHHDLIKAGSRAHLQNMLDGGIVARECLGSSSDSDNTPFDTDLTQLTGNQSVQSAIDATGIRQFGDIFIVVRNRGQFARTNDKTRSFDPGKYELFHGGYLGDGHMGIRTGFPSSDIELIAVHDSMIADDRRREELFFDIVAHGRYVPIVNLDGRVLLTPDMYAERRRLFDIPEHLSFDRSELAAATAADDAPDRILALLERDFGAELDKDAGVEEGYSLRRHTRMVLTQFRRYFGHLPDQEAWMAVAGLHDIGKPEAMARFGKEEQHRYTAPVVYAALRKLGYTHRQTRVWTAIVSDDPIGPALKGQPLDEAAKRVAEIVRKADAPFDEVFDKLLTLYCIDAGSYTEDAGGQASLDGLFDFDRANGTMRLREGPAARAERLRAAARGLCLAA